MTLSADEFALPDRIAVDAKGYGWRVWNGSDFWSMVPTNPDNSPIPRPVTWFVPENATALALLGEVVDWLGVPDWSGPQLPDDLARRIAACLDAASSLSGEGES